MKHFRLFNRLIAITIVILLMGSVLILWKKWQLFLTSAIIKPGQSVHIFFYRGDTIRNLIKTLNQKVNLNNPEYLVWYVKLKGVQNQLKAGEYNFTGPLTPIQLINQLIQGKVVQHKIIFVAGKTIQQILQQLNHDTNLAHHSKELSQNELLLKLNIHHNYLEGLFFPDTYQYTYGTSDLIILKKAHQHMLRVLQQAWNNRAVGLPYKNPYQALIVASLVEKESALPIEQAMIAGVILNRLRKNMYLQIDPTVIYAVGSQFNGVITKHDLRIDNPYNTYRYKGLPPSPICLPGKSAIYAALHPIETQYLYFVAKGKGRHAFSKTLQQHDCNIQHLLFDQKTLEGKGNACR